MPVTWVACLIRPSTPARLAYRACQWLVSCSARAAVTASWISRGRKVSWRPDDDLVHLSRAGHARHVCAGNRTTMTSAPLAVPGLQRVLGVPRGQVTWRLSQSMVNALLV